ncbi:MAG: ABC transporter permease, partial [Boseongicola sp. SB0673_bin_14]|nr:ABC transporter permease [Boseongicola sp. SB0673_bin_14]
MEPLTWTGSLSVLDPIFLLAWVALGIAVVVQIVATFLAAEDIVEHEVSASTRKLAEYAVLGVKIV